MIQFTIPGEPQGKARARTGYNPKVGRVTSTTPEKTVNYEALIKQIYHYEINKGKVSQPTEIALEMSIKAFYGIPKSTSKKNTQLMLLDNIRPCKKPDIDNIAKIICDALNGLAYKDDTQIVWLKVEKHYSSEPRVEVSIREWGNG